jgi:hypothetical protein
LSCLRGHDLVSALVHFSAGDERPTTGWVTGLEDTVVPEDGRPASGNRQLVRAAARMADEV